MSVQRLEHLPAPAKLNLFLKVVGRRADGYHLLQSLFVFIDWQDTLHLERRGDGALHRHDLGLPLPADDLCLRAARALKDASGTPWGADIHILKVLPSGAGLGGGSSDAATVLLGLNRLWGLRWTTQQLAALGLRLGADVPFFIHGRNAVVEGIGERIHPVPVRPQAYCVVKPPEGLDTVKIFRDADLKRDSKPAIVEGFPADHFEVEALLEQLSLSGWPENDLQPVAQRHCPSVTQALQWLRSRYGHAQMSGSGSAVFAREGASNEAFLASAGSGNSCENLPPGWAGRWCQGLNTHPLVECLD